jgi:hypothetical protein
MPRNKKQNTVQKTEPPPPAAPTYIPTKSNIANDIASNVVSGFAFGAGSSIARNAMDNMFQQKPEPKKESTLHTEYLECLKHNHEDTCKTFFPQI